MRKRIGLTFGTTLSSGALGILILAASITSGSATTLSYSVDTGLSDPTGSTNLFSLPKFAGGGLNSVTVTLDGQVAGSVKFANNGTVDPVVTKPGTAAAFVSGPAAGASCTAGPPVKCDKWTIGFSAAPHAPVFEGVTSTLGAKVQIQVGPSATLIVTLPASAPIADSLQFGPDYSADTYGFTRTYEVTSGAKQSAATVFSEVTNPTSHGTVAGANAHVWKVDILNPAYPGNFQPNGVFSDRPCDTNFSNAGCVVGANTYLVGKTYGGLSGLDSASDVFSAPADLAFFSGPGNFSFSEQAFGNSTYTGGGNDIFVPQAKAGGIVTVVYDYTGFQVPEPASLTLLGSALLAGSFAARRKKKAKAELG